jgi:hypothetical protein
VLSAHGFRQPRRRSALLPSPGHPHNQNHNHDDDDNERDDLEYLKVARPTRHPGITAARLTPPSFIPRDTSTFLTPLWHRAGNLTSNSFACATVILILPVVPRRILEHRRATIPADAHRPHTHPARSRERSAGSCYRKSFEVPIGVNLQPHLTPLVLVPVLDGAGCLLLGKLSPDG